VHRRTHGGRRRGRDDHRRREYKRQGGLISARPEQACGERDRGADNRDPAKAAKPGKETGSVCQVRSCDERQRYSSSAPPNAIRSTRPARNHFASRAIIAGAKPRAATPHADPRFGRGRSSRSYP
jgi:hypothetical protein